MQEQIKILLSLMILLLIILVLSSCATVDANKLKPLNSHAFAAESMDGSIYNKKTDQHIYCTDEKFDDFVCYNYEDLKEIISSCQPKGEVVPYK